MHRFSLSTGACPCRPTALLSTKYSLTGTNDNFTTEKQLFRSVKLQLFNNSRT